MMWGVAEMSTSFTTTTLFITKARAIQSGMTPRRCGSSILLVKLLSQVKLEALNPYSLRIDDAPISSRRKFSPPS